MTDEIEWMTTRSVTKKECPWLKKAVRKGTTVYSYWGATYGCIGFGRAVTLKRGQTPFFELPRDALAPARS